MKKVNKNMREQIRGAILNEYKDGNNPNDTSLKMQKLYGCNFETRYSTIRLWFEQFYLGDESLECDPYREDLMATRLKKNKPKKQVPTESPSTSAFPNSLDEQTLPTNLETQTKLLFKLKEQVDLLYKKINAQDCCLQLVDRFFKIKLKKPNTRSSSCRQPVFYDSIDGDNQKSLETFCTNYQYLRKKCQQISSKNNRRSNFYKILYNSLYSTGDDDDEKTDTIRGRSRSRQRSKSSKSKRKNKSPYTQVGKKKKAKPVVYGPRNKGGRRKAYIPQEDLLPATCEKCGKILKNRYRLNIHIQSIHERGETRFFCTFEGCGVSYQRKVSLRKHVEIVHTKDAREYRCTWANCSYVAYKLTMLRTHLNVHTGERPYKCVWPGCEKAFKSHSSLDFHKSIHENKRQYKCQWSGCGYACNVPQNLKKHTAIHERKQSSCS